MINRRQGTRGTWLHFRAKIPGIASTKLVRWRRRKTFRWPLERWERKTTKNTGLTWGKQTAWPATGDDRHGESENDRASERCSQKKYAWRNTRRENTERDNIPGETENSGTTEDQGGSITKQKCFIYVTDKLHSRASDHRRVLSWKISRKTIIERYLSRTSETQPENRRRVDSNGENTCSCFKDNTSSKEIKKKEDVTSWTQLPTFSWTLVDSRKDNALHPSRAEFRSP